MSAKVRGAEVRGACGSGWPARLGTGMGLLESRP